MFRLLLKQDIKALQVFIAVVECQGVSAAQARLNMAQSVISTHLAHLEARFGFILCKRGRSGFALTQEGAAVYQAGLQLSAAASKFSAEIQEIKLSNSVLDGELHLVLVDHLPKAFVQSLFQAIELIYQKYPKVQLVADIRSPQEIETALLAGQADLGIGYFARPLKNLNYFPLFSERQSVYCRANHPVLSSSLTAERVAQEYAWVKRGYLFSPDLLPVRPKHMTATSYHMEATLLFIMAGSHIGYLPEDYAQPYVDKGMLMRLLPESLSYTVTHDVVRRAEDNPLVDAFLSLLKREYLNHEQQPNSPYGQADRPLFDWA